MPGASCVVSVRFGEPVAALAAGVGAVAIGLGRDVCCLVMSGPAEDIEVRRSA
jgi:hypothetical protein